MKIRLGLHLARFPADSVLQRLVLVAVVAVAASQFTYAQDQIPLVNIKAVDPSIVVELRYAGSKNIAQRPLYAPSTAALVRPDVAHCLAKAQAFLKSYQYSLKIWDAYRPPRVQEQLWRAAAMNDYVADPSAGAGSLHSWGVAVDATLTDFYNRKVKMPTDYDNFTPASVWIYQGTDPAVRTHLKLLQAAMRDAGFLGLRTEWWHFTVEGWEKLLPPEEARRAMQAFGTAGQSKL